MTQRLRASALLLVSAWTATAALHAQTPAAPADAATPPAGDDDVVALERFTVEDRITDPSIAIGTDMTRATASITREALLSAPAGYSGLKMLESLPGFNVQTSDALGLYEFGNSVFVRAFNYTQISFVLDGIPMGRSAQFGGSPIYRYVDNENIARVTATSGSGEVTAPGYNSLGPNAIYSTIAPAEKPGATVAVTTGTHDLERSFVKLQSGEWHGFSAYVSRSKNDAAQWRGAGTFEREHWDGKLRYEFGDGQAVQFTVSHNDYFDWDSPSISLAQYNGTTPDPFGRVGRYFGYIGYVPNLAPAPAFPTIPFSNANHTAYYLQAINSRTDTLYGLNAVINVGDSLTFDATAYYDDKEGYGVSFADYAATRTIYLNQVAAGVTGLTAPRGVQYGISYIDGYRLGLNSKATWTIATQKIEAGFWIEEDHYKRRRLRNNLEGGNPAGRVLYDEIVNKLLDFQSRNDTLQLFLKDTATLLDNKLVLEAGVKALAIDYEIKGHRGSAAAGTDYNQHIEPKISDEWTDWFLPQVGAVYKLTDTEQLFASFAENFARPQADDVYSQASYAGTELAEAEHARNVEVGVRTNRPVFNAALALYQTEYKNRLQTFASRVEGTNLFDSHYQNVGRVEAQGVELAGGVRPPFVRSLAFNGSITYNHAEFKNNYVTQTSATAAPTTVAIAGKRIPDSPEWLVQFGATYEPWEWVVATLSGRYLSDRYSNFLNTEIVGGYVVWAGSVEVSGEQLGYEPLKHVKFRFNVDNIFDRDALGTISAGTTGTGTFRPIPDRTFQFSLIAQF